MFDLDNWNLVGGAVQTGRIRKESTLPVHEEPLVCEKNVQDLNACPICGYQHCDCRTHSVSNAIIIKNFDQFTSVFGSYSENNDIPTSIPTT